MAPQTIDSTIDIVWSAYRSILSKAGSLAYTSTAITSGVLMQDTMDETGLSEAELKASPEFFSLVIKPNLDRGTAAARVIASTSDRPVVAPSIFEGKAQRWSQADYMKMWLAMIEEHVTKMYMLPGWEYSNGGCEEYLKAVNMAWGFGSRHDILPLTPDGQPVTLHEGMELIAAALEDIHSRGRKADSLAITFDALYGAYYVWVAREISRDDLPKEFNREFMMATDYSRVNKLHGDLDTLLREDYSHLDLRCVNRAVGAVRELTALPEGLLIVPEEVEPDEEED